MIRLDRICVWLIILSMAMIIPSQELLKFGDEIIVYTMGGVALFGVIFSRDRKRFMPLIVFACIIAAYTLYSLTAVHYNTKSAVMLGVILECKPYIAFFTPFCIAPVLTAGDKRILRYICIFNAIVCLGLLLGGEEIMKTIVGHWAYWGATCMVTAITLLYIARTDDGCLRLSDLILILAVLTMGVFCLRSKYYAEYVFFVALLLFYRQQMFRRFNWKVFAGSALTILIVALAVREKFMYYFIGNAIDNIDLNNIESYARPALYFGALLTLEMHPLLGSGFGSYASHASVTPYSGLYNILGLDKVWGLSPDNPNFVSDAYYASLAQFGIVGILLFIYFWIWVYRKLLPLTRSKLPECKFAFVAGVMIIAMALIESTTGTVMFNTQGETAMMILGVICASATRIKSTETTKNSID